MEATRNSLLEQQLYQLKSSARTNGEFTSFLQGLRKVIVDLIDHPYGGRYNLVNQYSEVFAKELFRTQETRDFLILLGYIGGNGQFIYNTSDENMSKLEDCLEIVESLIRQQEETVLCEINGNKGCRRSSNQEGKKAKDPFDSFERSRSKESRRCSSGMKEMFLSKHMKKEMSDDMVGKKNISRSSDFAFNTNGYYHQSCTKSDTKRNKRCFLRELFHKQDHDTKGWNSSGLNVKPI